jgi:4-amino-4-deoxy-L-arabinose transferase-like glycosyltransferase
MWKKLGRNLKIVTKKQPVSQAWIAFAIITITILAVILRIWGIRWGLPDSLHRFTYHPDEVFQVGSMLQMNPFKLLLDPGFYNYPSGYMNLGAGLMRVAESYGLNLNGYSYNTYLIARVLTAVLGAVTIPVIYLIGNKMWGRSVGIIAAFVFAITPLHIVHSQFATVDVPATLWISLALLGAIFITSRPTFLVYVLAGAAVGMAAGTKYNAGLVILPVLLAHFQRDDKATFLKRLTDVKLLVVIGGCLVGFLIATPQVLLLPDKYLSGILYELGHAASGHGHVFDGRGPGWLDLMSSLGYGIGVFLLLFCLLAVSLAIVRRSKADWILLSFIIPYFLMISLSEVRFARYTIPILSYLFLETVHPQRCDGDGYSPALVLLAIR